MHEYRLHETRYRNSGSSKLDDWVLCRIYKKNSSSSQEPLAILSAAASSGKEHSHASSSSSSSLDDMLEALPGMDGQFFAHAHPRMHTVKAEHQPQGQKPYLQSCLESSSFNWAALAGSSSGGPEPSYAQPQPHLANYANNDASYTLAVPPPPMPTAAATQLWRQAFNPMADQEVQSGLRGGARQQLGAFHQGSGLLEQAPTTSIDPLFYRYPASQSTGFGYRQ
ncbi:hypothetical protein SAY87_004131 [Trapa incisa]|uniref:NAC domain-containing protein n=1 Tax=Trapa incisa TaxID=236973 RepID=A0AAN7PLK2_9MYRT|nr:hypothetical protein SAY87_004131 [Trapa incisa]